LLVAAAQRQRGLGAPRGQVDDEQKHAPRKRPSLNAPAYIGDWDGRATDAASHPRVRPRDRGPVHIVVGLLAAMFVIMSTVLIVRAWPRRPIDSPSASTLPRCTTSDRGGACWATTVVTGTNQGVPCPHQVSLFLRKGGLICLNGNDLVEIACYYKGGPTVNGDQFQDHVVMVDAGRRSVVGHIPDGFISLGRKSPPAVGIPLCGPSTGPSPVST
jgi:hypothetical protein